MSKAIFIVFSFLSDYEVKRACKCLREVQWSIHKNYALQRLCFNCLLPRMIGQNSSKYHFLSFFLFYVFMFYITYETKPNWWSSAEFSIEGFKLDFISWEGIYCHVWPNKTWAGQNIDKSSSNLECVIVF